MSQTGARPRVVVVGASCAGKSTFARALSQSAGVACIDLDDLFWAPGWQPRPEQDFVRLVHAGASAPAWTAAGNYRVARDALWPRATAIVWLDFSLPRVLWRCLARTWRRCARRELLPHGNRESFRRSFLSRDSLFLWIWNTHAARRAEYQALRASGAFPQLTWFRVRHPREAEALLQDLQRGWHAAVREEQQATPG